MESISPNLHVNELEQTSSKKKGKSNPSYIPKTTTHDTLDEEEIEWMSDLTEDAIQRRKDEALGSTLLADMVQEE